MAVRQTELSQHATHTPFTFVGLLGATSRGSRFEMLGDVEHSTSLMFWHCGLQFRYFPTMKCCIPVAAGWRAAWLLLPGWLKAVAVDSITS